MKKLVIAAGCLALATGFVGCGGAHGEDPGEAYMPDMYYSRAYETYNYNDVGGELDSLKRRGIFYNAMPVEGTIARGDAMPYHFTSIGDSARMAEATGFKNPLDSAAATKPALKEAERLYLVNCGICHGTSLKGDGPIAASGAYPAAPKDLTAPDSKGFSDGHFFYVITYGKGMMGSYASQLTPAQRWWVIKYIRSKQGAATPAKSDSSAVAAKPKGDSTKTGK